MVPRLAFGPQGRRAAGRCLGVCRGGARVWRSRPDWRVTRWRLLGRVQRSWRTGAPCCVTSVGCRVAGRRGDWAAGRPGAGWGRSRTPGDAAVQGATHVAPMRPRRHRCHHRRAEQRAPCRASTPRGSERIPGGARVRGAAWRTDPCGLARWRERLRCGAPQALALFLECGPGLVAHRFCLAAGVLERLFVRRPESSTASSGSGPWPGSGRHALWTEPDRAPALSIVLVGGPAVLGGGRDPSAPYVGVPPLGPGSGRRMMPPCTPPGCPRAWRLWSSDEELEGQRVALHLALPLRRPASSAQWLTWMAVCSTGRTPC